MGEARIIDGRTVAAAVRRCVAEAALRLRRAENLSVGLAAVLVGDDPASDVYVRSKGRACGASGIASFERRLPADASPAAVIAEVERLNRDEQVDGVLVQLPL